MSYTSKFTGSQIDAGIDAANAALPKSGGAMTGALILNNDPTVDNGAATKKYVDEQIENISLTPGEPGVSVTHSWNGTTLTVTSASGTSSANLKGDKGDTGEDGVSPTVEVAEITGGNRVTITDANGAKSFDVMDGADGTGGSGGGSSIDNSDVVNLIYPVGSIYMSVNAASPATLFGGEWEQIKDTFLLSAGDTYAAGTTGGEAEHTLTVDEMPNHNHKLMLYTGATSGNYSGGKVAYQTGGLGTVEYNCRLVGGDQPHNNMPPYLAVYMWKRTA